MKMALNELVNALSLSVCLFLKYFCTVSYTFSAKIFIFVYVYNCLFYIIQEENMKSLCRSTPNVIQQHTNDIQLKDKAIRIIYCKDRSAIFAYNIYECLLFSQRTICICKQCLCMRS